MIETSMVTCFTYTFADENWIVDTGASKHMASKLSLLIKSHKLLSYQEGEVHLPTGTLAKIYNLRPFKIFGGFEITDVLQILEFKYNLLFVSSLTRTLNYCVLFVTP